MEGRHPPPRATHPFPDKVDFSRFWSNKQTVKGFFKFASVFCPVYLGLLYTYYWFNKDYPYIAGIKLRTQEEMDKRIEIHDKAAEVKQKNFSVLTMQMSFKTDKFIKDKPNVDGFLEDRNIVFDDDVRYSPGMIFNLPPVPETKEESDTKSK